MSRERVSKRHIDDDERPKMLKRKPHREQAKIRNILKNVSINNLEEIDEDWD